ncbi:MAG: hypothetical protein Fur0025_35820 [Oscillatoriaceae cyanobacterium]
MGKNEEFYYKILSLGEQCKHDAAKYRYLQNAAKRVRKVARSRKITLVNPGKLGNE